MLNFKLLCSVRLAKTPLPSTSSTKPHDEVVTIHDSLPYGTDEAETQEPLDDVETIMDRLKKDTPEVDEDMSDHSVPCPLILFVLEFCVSFICFNLLGRQPFVFMVWDMDLSS